MNARGTLEVARLGTVEYARALELQDALVAARRDDLIGDTLLLLEHPHVFTLGRGADERYLLETRPGVPVFRVSRGGEVTYHGPGQLIGYPILKLEGRDRDVHVYLRRLERVMIETLAQMGIDARRREGLTGVWVGERKIGSIGVGLRRWITLHGFALNVSTDLSYFGAMVPCGIAGVDMTSVARETDGRARVEVADSKIDRAFVSVFGYARCLEADAAALWRRVDRASTGCDAQIRI
ncbi:MAG TPA: lipoyl(octanoyl) transferase LipB [Candidatus Binataceae bacterium]|nr:lipoyl(octanoyl) transferase LipB [Candidatus Binataceae bacterium]